MQDLLKKCKIKITISSRAKVPDFNQTTYFIRVFLSKYYIIDGNVELLFARKILSILKYRHLSCMLKTRFASIL